MFPPVKHNEIKARFDDEIYELILEQCRKRRKRRAEVIREIVEGWFDEQERKAISNAA